MGLVSLCKLGEVPSQEPEGLPANPVGRRRSPALCWKRGVLHTLIKTGKEGRRSKEWCRRWRGWVRGGSKSAWCRRTGRPKPCPLSCSCCSQFSRPGPQSVPLQLSARWQCGAALTQVSVEYSYRPGATAVPTPLTNVQILLPVGEPVTNIRLQPAATW